MPIAAPDKRDNNRKAIAKMPSKKPHFQKTPLKEAIKGELLSCNGKPDAYQKTIIIQRLAAQYHVDRSLVRKWVNHLGTK